MWALNIYGDNVNYKFIVLSSYASCFVVSTISVWYMSPNITDISINDIFSIIVSSIISVALMIKIKRLRNISEPRFMAGIKFAAFASLILFILTQMPPFGSFGRDLDSHLLHAGILGVVVFLVSLLVMPACGFVGVLLKKYLEKTRGQAL